MSDNNGLSSLTSRLPFGALVVVFLITFAIWIFFYVLDMPLKPPSTTVVALMVLAVVMLVRWLWTRSHRKGEAG